MIRICGSCRPRTSPMKRCGTAYNGVRESLGNLGFSRGELRRHGARGGDRRLKSSRHPRPAAVRSRKPSGGSSGRGDDVHGTLPRGRESAAFRSHFGMPYQYPAHLTNRSDWWPRDRHILKYDNQIPESQVLDCPMMRYRTPGVRGRGHFPECWIRLPPPYILNGSRLRPPSSTQTLLSCV